MGSPWLLLGATPGGDRTSQRHVAWHGNPTSERPIDDPHSHGGPPSWTAEGARAPTHAERARTLVAGELDGTLATLTAGAQDVGDGHPFGSVVTYATDEAGAPLVLMSTMAEHARNLDGDARCSLLVTGSGDGAGRLAAERATLLGTMTPVPEDQQDAATQAYLDVHPDAFWAEFPDFFVARLEVTAIRYVRGFGEMGWADAEDYAAAEPDPVAPAEAEIVQHMNDDHADALAAIVHHVVPVPDGVTVEGVRQLSCDRYGFEVRLTTNTQAGLAFARIGFDEPLQAAEEARGAMVALTNRARAAQGQ